MNQWLIYLVIYIFDKWELFKNATYIIVSCLSIVKPSFVSVK